MIVKLGTIHRCNKNEFADEKEKLKIRSFVIEALLKIELDMLTAEYAIKEEIIESNDESSMFESI
jgi:hypothetical protein